MNQHQGNNQNDRVTWFEGRSARCVVPPQPRSSVWRVVLLGAPGVGKGTQAALLSERLGTCHLSTGEVFRAARSKPRSPAMAAALDYMRQGKLVPDQTVWEMVRERIACLRCLGGFVLDGFPRTVYHFPPGSSVVLAPADGVIPTNIYTIVLLFRFDGIAGWRRILDFKNPPSDLGLYALNGALDFYNASPTGPNTFAPSNYVQAVITRDASSNVVAYLNGIQQFSFVDSGNLATLAGSPEMLRFFKDNTGEDSAGAIARIRLYDKVMPPNQVANLDRLTGGPAPLQFVQPMYYSNRVMYLTLQVTPNVTYSVQASTNFVNWVAITNVTSSTPLILISDPQAPNFPRRFYRGLTQLTSVTVAQPVITNVTRLPGPQLSFTLTGTPGITYTVEISTNLANWTVRSNCTIPGDGLFQFLEPNAASPPVRFYRARWP